MSSTVKALELLRHFTVTQPELGLSRICQLANRDKATTYRYLQALEEAGFVEQIPSTRHYRLGPAVLQLAHTREVTVPRKSGAEAALGMLADTTGETSHVSVLSGNTLYPLVAVEPPRHGIRAVIDMQTLPLHATASGICALAFGPAALRQAALSNPVRFNSLTLTEPGELDEVINLARSTGFARSYGGMDEDINGLAAPLFDQTGQLAGAVSVATVATRFTPELDYLIRLGLVEASRKISRNWGGSIPDQLEACWAKTNARKQPPSGSRNHTKKTTLEDAS